LAGWASNSKYTFFSAIKNRPISTFLKNRTSFGLNIWDILIKQIFELNWKPFTVSEQICFTLSVAEHLINIQVTIMFFIFFLMILQSKYKNEKLFTVPL
jgi:hypothetical protein